MQSVENEKGNNFKRILDQSSYTLAEFARAMNVENPQTINNWRKRGVPAAKAFRAANLLGCNPEDISKLILSEADYSDNAKLERRKQELKNYFATLLAETDDPEVLELFYDQVELFHKRMKRSTQRSV